VHKPIFSLNKNHLRGILAGGTKYWHMENTDKVEILEAIALVADHMQEMRFDIADIKTKVGSLDARVKCLDARTTRIEATMVTKDYLDDKLANLHSDVVQFVKRRVPCWTDARV
jgi:hypothetical protein